MHAPIKVIDIELSDGIQAIESLSGYKAVKGLVRLHGVPIGYLELPVTNGTCRSEDIFRGVIEELNWPVIVELLSRMVEGGVGSGSGALDTVIRAPRPECKLPLPTVTVAVCTRDRAEQLAACLDSISQLQYPQLEILVIDNAPSSDAVKRLVCEKFPDVRYIEEPRPGLNWARNRAALEATSDIIAYTDDDVTVDANWVKELARVFAENPEVMAVTGLIVPFELETEAQLLFEKHNSFHTSFDRRWFGFQRGSHLPWHFFGAVQCGAGANMAFRRALFQRIGLFDPALDAGTLSKAGGDLEFFFRLLKEGNILVHEPNALVRHHHRRSYQELKEQLFNNATGLIASCIRCASYYPDERRSLVRQFVHWTRQWHLSTMVRSFLKPTFFPRELILTDIKGCLNGLTSYRKSQRAARAISQEYDNIPFQAGARDVDVSPPAQREECAIAVRNVELSLPLQPLNDVTEYNCVRVFASWKGSPLGSVDVWNLRQPVSSTRLARAIAETLNTRLLEPTAEISDNMRWASAVRFLTEHWKPRNEHSAQDREGLPEHIPVSIVVGTYDRPDDLRKCLQGLVKQNSARPLEIIVVDNHPSSGLTPPIVNDFSGVLLVSEPRSGVAYARNAGIAASSGEIIVTTDDDLSMSDDWLEKLLAPFARADVMAVTGNVLPAEMETQSQYLFEQYGEGGLGRGYKRWAANAAWFDGAKNWAVPTWLLGATSNSAFRAEIFCDPEIGLMDEALGPGMPSGVGEDIYLFYKILRAGHTIIYEPAACVWHTHRRTMKALRRQLYNYSKGCVAYQITTLLYDGDCRALRNIFYDLPLWHVRRVAQRLRGRSPYPVHLILVEAAGHLMGPLTLWRSRRRVRFQGRSTPGKRNERLCNQRVSSPQA